MAMSKRERLLLVLTLSAVFIVVTLFLVTSLIPKWRAVEGGLYTQRRELASMQDIISRKPGCTLSAPAAAAT